MKLHHLQLWWSPMHEEESLVTAVAFVKQQLMFDE